MGGGLMTHAPPGAENPLTRCLLCCLKCCFWCLEKFIKFLNRNAYIMVGGGGWWGWGGGNGGLEGTGGGPRLCGEGSWGVSGGVGLIMRTTVLGGGAACGRDQRVCDGVGSLGRGLRRGLSEVTGGSRVCIEVTGRSQCGSRVYVLGVTTGVMGGAVCVYWEVLGVT